MKILKEIFKRPVTIFFIILVAMVLGFVSTSSMAINLLPNIGFPYLSVQTVYVGADAELIDKEITRPMENSVSKISDLREISTYSIDNASIVVLQFEYGTNIDKKKTELEDCIHNVKLPEGSEEPTISEIDLNTTSMLTLMVYAESMEDTYTSAKAMEAKLASIAGVENTSLTGAPESKIRVDMIHGLEAFAGLIVEEIAYDSGYDIPLGEIASGGSTVSVNNKSGVQTIDELKKLTVSANLSAGYLEAFQSLQNTIQSIEDMNTEDLEKLHQDAIDMNRFMDELDLKPNSELDAFYDDVSTMKALISLVESYSAATLNMMWNTTLKGVVEDEDFKNMSDDDLHDLAEDLDVSYELLKWLQDNSDVNPATGKTYAEEKWDIIVEFRRNHPEDIPDSEYPQLFYDLEVFSSDTSSEDYKSEEEIIDDVRACRVVSLVGLNNYVNKRTENEEITDSDYAVLFATATNDYDIPMTAQTIRMIRSEHFEENYQIFYAYKQAHQHEEEETNEETNEVSTTIKGDPISSKDFMSLYNQMIFTDELDLEPTERLIDFIRDVDFAGSAVKFTIEQACEVYLESVYTSRAYYNGKEAIQIDLYGSSSSNATEVSKTAQKLISEYNTSNSLATIVMLNNQADFINDSLSNALVSLLIGMVLAVMVIYLFLRKVKASLIIALSMPLSVLCTLACLYLMGITLNMVSVGGLAVGIGMLVDNSIVVLESITSERAKGQDVLTASINGVKLVLGSLIGSTITSICVFFPILCISGLTKEIFADLSWAVILSLSFSLLVAVIVIPTLFCFFFKKEEVSDERKKTKIFNRITHWYSGVLERCLRHKGIVILGSLGVFFLSFLLIFVCDIEFLPSIDQQKIEVNIPFASGDEDNYCQKTTYECYQILSKSVDNIEYISMSVGYSGMIQTSQSGTVYLQLKKSKRKTKDIVEDVREILESSSFTHDYSVSEIDGVVATLVGGMSGVSVTVYGDEVEVLKEIAKKVEEDVLKKNGIKRASDNMLSQSESYTITFDKEKLVDNGVDYVTAVSTLRIGMAGYDASIMNIDEDEYNVCVGWSDDSIDYYGSLEKIIVGVNSDGDFVRLSDVAQITLENGRHIIRKVGGKNLLSISVETYGIDTNTASKYLKASVEGVLKDYDGYTFSSSGVSSYLTDAFRGLVIALIVSFFLLFGVMACLFESLRKPCIIIFSFPFAFVGGFIALAVSGVGINVVSFIGLIMLMGVIINDAIVLNERIDQLVLEGLEPKKAVIEGCRQRLRAVLMTTLTTVLALIPMALGIGKGSELMQPLGVVAIGGMTLGTCVTLILIPSVYCVFYRIKYNKDTIIYTGEDYLDSVDETIDIK